MNARWHPKLRPSLIFVGAAGKERNSGLSCKPTVFPFGARYLSTLGEANDVRLRQRQKLTGPLSGQKKGNSTR